MNEEQRTKNNAQRPENNAQRPPMKIERFEDIEGWKAGRVLACEIYSASRMPGFAQDYGLKDQIQRASGSIMHNIAEGFDAGSNAEFVRFLRYSQRSCSEVQSQLYVALDQAYINETQFQKLYKMTAHAKAKVGGFIAYLLKSDAPREK